MEKKTTQRAMSPASKVPFATQQPVPVGSGEMTYLLPWGQGPDQVGLSPALPEHQAEGVSSVAVDEQGHVFLLDRFNQRVLRMEPQGPTVAARVPEPATDLAVGADGALAVLIPLRWQVVLYAGGEPAGALSIPRVIRFIRHITLGASRQILVSTALQETFRLGSPSVPQRLPAILQSKREGAVLLDSHRGVTVHRRADGRPVLTIRARGEHAPARAQHPLAEPVLAARIIGALDDLVCLRLEKNVPTTDHFQVQRQVTCINLTSGQPVLTRDLPPPGLYLPHHELALGGHLVTRLAFIHPEQEGLRLRIWPVDHGAGKESEQ